MQQNPNMGRAKMIADKYATNARGAVTGLGRNCFAIGQAIAPIISGVLYNVDPSVPYALTAFLIGCNLALFVVTGVPLFHDPPPPEPTVVATPAAPVKSSAELQPAVESSQA